MGTNGTKCHAMKIDEELIGKKIKELIKKDAVHYYQKSTQLENVKCKGISNVRLLPSEDEICKFRVSGRGSFYEDFGNGTGKETNKDFGTEILVQGDDIINVNNIKVRF